MPDRVELPNLKAEWDGEELRFFTATEFLVINRFGLELRYEGPGGTLLPREAKVQTRVVGHGNCQRVVEHYLPRDPERPEKILRCGMTSHMGDSTWSSLPHEFEQGPLEAGFEEVFFYRLHPEHGFAIQVRRGLDHEGGAVGDVSLVADCTFRTIPMGYHPVVGEPGVHVTYFWAYLAKKPEWEKA